METKILPFHKRLARLYLPFNPRFDDTRRQPFVSDVTRHLEREERNASGLYTWASKRCSQTGSWPRLSGYRFERHGNSTVVKLPRRKRQLVGAEPPQPPEAA